MPAMQSKKRKSGQMSTAEGQTSRVAETSKVLVQDGDGSPAKKRKTTISITQKQALIDNLQLEITERARKLRAQYNLQAQSLRTRIEMRVNRIPKPLRSVTMGDLLHKYTAKTQEKPIHAPPPAATAAKPPPVPEKDFMPARPALHRALLSQAAPSRSEAPFRIQVEDDYFAEGDKENGPEPTLGGKSRPDTAKSQARQGQPLSPATANSRAIPRAASPAKSALGRPASPTKGTASTLLSNMVEKARSTRAAASTRNRPATASSTTSSSTSAATASATTRTRRGAAATAAGTASPVKASTAKTTRQRAAVAGTRTTRRASGISEASDGSTSTVVRTRTAAATGAAAAKKVTAVAAPAKRTVMGTIKQGVGAGAAKTAAGRKAAAAAAAPAVPGGARVLRKRM